MGIPEYKTRRRKLNELEKIPEQKIENLVIKNTGIRTRFFKISSCEDNFVK